MHYRNHGLEMPETWPAFDWADPFLLDASLREEEKLVRDSARSFAQARLMPLVQEMHRSESFDRGLLREMGSLGLLGSTLPDFGGVSPVGYGLTAREFERVDSAFRSSLSVQSSLVMHPIHAFGSVAQREKYLPKLATGEWIGSFGLTEPDHGSDPGSMETRAQRKGSAFVLNGTKRWITNGTIADIAIVWAKLDGEVRGFIVEAGTPGFQAPEIKNKLSLRASVTSDLNLDDVEVPEENLLPETGGIRSPLMCLNQARYGIAWGALGAAMACYEWAVDYTKQRTQFGKPVAAFQLVQEKLAFMLTEITKGQLLAWRLGRLKDAGRLHFTQTSLAKRNNVRIALETARLARDLMGASGITLEYPVFRHMCNLESVYTYEGTDHIHTLILGEHITGIPAYS